ncbi:hypothetical protein ABZT03_16335 [Streptomyces sp. NPDC005574]|uniref:hypothetical protein n=1 Tax=Streptomyces sp. NPDC005574 TaxID=3156891 RepID=UPI0033B6EC0F
MTHDPHQENPADPGRPNPDEGDGGWELISHGGAEPSGPPGARLRDAWRRRSVRARTVAAAATVAVLAVGGVAYAASSGSDGGGAAPVAAASASPSGSPGAPGERPGRGMWFGLGGDPVHGEVTVKDRDTGKWVVRVWQWGTAEKVNGDQVTVRSEDGASWTWTIDSDTSVFRDGAPDSGSGAVKKGETYYLAGSRAQNGTRTAARVLSGTWRDGYHGRYDGGSAPRDEHPGPGHGPRDRHAPAPSSSPSPPVNPSEPSTSPESGATT